MIALGSMHHLKVRFFWGKNGFYNTWVTRADGLWVLTVNSNRLTTFIDNDRWFRVGGNSKGESESKDKNRIRRAYNGYSDFYMAWVRAASRGFLAMIHIQPRTGEVEAVGEGSRTGYKICHIKGHFWPFWSILTSKITYQLHTPPWSNEKNC